MRSIIGQFLEHSRVFYFSWGTGDAQNNEEYLYLSSADWMERNLDRRVETCFPVESKKLVTRVKKELEGFLSDNTQSWILQPDGSYVRNSPTGNQNARNVQSTLLERLTGPQVGTR